MPPTTVKVDRSTPWGNPFITGKHGTQQQCADQFLLLFFGFLCITCDRECVQAQEASREYVEKHIGELKGKNLACWCRTGTPCHADHLLALANGDEEVLRKRAGAVLDKLRHG